MFPSKENLTICFAHAAYQMKDRFELRKTGIRNFQVWAYDDLVKRVGEADVVVVSGMWKNDVIPHAGKLKFIQSISSGMDQYSKEQLGAKNVRLASAAGVNARAVAEHAIALILAVARRLPEARDNQHKKFWRGMIGDLTQREDELGGKTLLIVGMGRIGSHLAMLAKAFDMKVIGIRRDPAQGANGADFDPRHGRSGEARAAGRLRGAHLRAHARDHGPDERRGLRRHEAVGGVRERGARQGGRRGGADQDACRATGSGRRRSMSPSTSRCRRPRRSGRCPTSSSRRTRRARPAPTKTT